MSDELPPVLCDDESTWRHKGEKIDLPRLLQLIEENGGPEGLDLHGCNMAFIDARPETLRYRVGAYARDHGRDAIPPWVARYTGAGIDLYAAHLEHANLAGAHLENADLEDAHLESAALLQTHLENAKLDGAHLEGAAFDDAHLDDASLGAAHLERATLDGTRLQRADLRDAHLQHAALTRAHLQDAFLWAAHLDDADLAGAHLENAVLEDADLRNAKLWAAHLEDAILLATHLEKTDLWGARLDRAFWYGSYLDRTRIRRESLGGAIGEELAAKGHVSHHYIPRAFIYARESYLALKTNFDSIGRYGDASWAYVKEQQMEKAMSFPTTVGHRWIRRSVRQGHKRWVRSKRGRLGRFVRGSILGRLQWAWLHLRLFAGLCPRALKQEMARRDERGQERDEWLSRWRWARNWAYELLTGYGERVYMPVIWAGVVVLLFALIYAAAGNIASGDVGALQSHPTHSLITALTHSISAFATVGFNTLEPVGWGARLLTAIEAMFGIGLFALFVFTLGNRMRRS